MQSVSNHVSETTRFFPAEPATILTAVSTAAELDRFIAEHRARLAGRLERLARGDFDPAGDPFGQS